MIYKPMSVRLLLAVEDGEPIEVGTATIDLPLTVPDFSPDLTVLKSELSTALHQAADAIWETAC